MPELSRTDQIKLILTELDQPAFRLQQILLAIYHENILDYAKMTNLPLILRRTLKQKLGEVLTLPKKILLSAFLPSPTATWAVGFAPPLPWV